MKYIFSFFFLFLGLSVQTLKAADIYKEKSMYRDISVQETGDRRCIWFGKQTGLSQSCIYIKSPDRMVFNYTKMVLGALYLNPSPDRILVIGLGGGILPLAFQKILPDAHIDVVELDPSVVKVAIKYFNYPEDQGKNVKIDDGRVYVKRALKKGEKYDLVVLDAFDEKYVPEHMATKEFLQELKQLITEGGVLASNTFSGSMLYDAESATYHSVFGRFYNLETNNRVILWRHSAWPEMVEIENNANSLDEKIKVFDTDKTWLLPLFKPVGKWPPETRILTDQYSPANLLNSKKMK